MKRFVVIGILLIGVLGLPGCQEFRETPRAGTVRVIDWSAETVENFTRLPRLKSFAKFIPEARGLLIFPAVVKGGFLVAAEGGTGVLIARQKGGGWGYPAFYTLAAASFGLQIGIQDTETILVIRNDGALRSIIKNQGKFGADLGISMGFYGAGMEASTTTNLGADVLAFTNAKVGVFAGASLEGAVLARRRDFNESFYGQGATPEGIVLEGRFRTAQADRLRSVLARF